MLKLRIVQMSESWVLVDKPARFHTHAPEDKKIRINPRWNALRILKEQLQEEIAPMHRLDRAASGLLVYARKNRNAASLHRQFAQGEVEKIYHVLMRGERRESLVIDRPLQSDAGIPLPSLTRVQPIFSFSLPLLDHLGENRKFTLASVKIDTGRFHQIRRHLAGAGHPLVGDPRHGDKKLNRAFAELAKCPSMFLRCTEISFMCPDQGCRISATTRWPREWHRLFDLAGACALIASPFPKQQTPS